MLRGCEAIRLAPFFRWPQPPDAGRHSATIHRNQVDDAVANALLIVGVNDTTRNSMSAGLLFLSQDPDEFAKLRAKPELVESMAPEIIRSCCGSPRHAAALR
jgi:hypothetical protein